VKIILFKFSIKSVKTAERIPDVENWMLDAGYSILDTRFWILDILF